MSAKRKLSAEEEDAVVDDAKTVKLDEEPVKDVSVPPPPAEPVVDKVKGDDGCGELLVCGSLAWDMTGRKALPKGAVGGGRCLWTPHRMAALQGVRVRLVASGCGACHNVIVTEQGSALVWGRNDFGQLGLGDTLARHTPEAVPALAGKTVVGAACGRRHTLFLVADGTVFAAGDNKMGQCGVGNTTPVINTATKIAYAGPPLVKVGCGGEFSLVLDIKGALHSFGCPEYGQLGHNTDGKYFVSCNKLGFHCETSPKRIVCFVEKSKDGHATPVEVNEIVDLSCGANHSVAVDDKRRVFSWGWGGLGRLGHAEQKDELVPRLLKFFDSAARGVRSVHCGASFSLALNQHGVVFMFGQTRRTGEANMYPKPVQDLNGWNVRCIAAGNTSIVVAADESVIAWGASPTYGELGFGEGQKSSANPREVRSLDGIFITQLAAGFGHTLMVARDDTEAARAAIAQMPEYQH